MDCVGFNEASWASWTTPVDDYANRESWLEASIQRLAASVYPAQALIDGLPKIRVTCGWPKGSRGGKGHATGQCWDRDSSDDRTYELFISPELSTAGEILPVVCHEMNHAIAGCEQGHKGDFLELCKAIGLVKPWTETTPSPELAAKLAIIGLQLGPYPHAKLNDIRKKQTARMLKATCPNPDCEAMLNSESERPYTVRLTQQWADAGMPTCPCGTEMRLEGGADAGEESENLAA